MLSILLSLLIPFTYGGPVKTCNDQEGCLRRTKMEQTGNYVEVCIEWKSGGKCDKAGAPDTISHACNGDGSKTEKWAENTQLCREVPCGEKFAFFGIKDGKGCAASGSTISPHTILDGEGNDITGVECTFTATSFPLGEKSWTHAGVCNDGNAQDCRWAIPITLKCGGKCDFGGTFPNCCPKTCPTNQNCDASTGGQCQCPNGDTDPTKCDGGGCKPECKVNEICNAQDVCECKFGGDPGSCEECNTDDDCPTMDDVCVDGMKCCPPNKPVLVDGECKECKDNADCPTMGEKCLGDNTCGVPTEMCACEQAGMDQGKTGCKCRQGCGGSSPSDCKNVGGGGNPTICPVGVCCCDGGIEGACNQPLRPDANPACPAGCESDGDCESDERCNTDTGDCEPIECKNDADCTGENEECDTENGKCKCKSGFERDGEGKCVCPEGTVSNSMGDGCVECNEDRDCPPGCGDCQCMGNMCMCPDKKTFEWQSLTKGKCVCDHSKGYQDDGNGGCEQKPRCEDNSDCVSCDGCECMGDPKMCMCPDEKIFKSTAPNGKGECVCRKGYEEDAAGGCKPKDRGCFPPGQQGGCNPFEICVYGKPKNQCECIFGGELGSCDECEDAHDCDQTYDCIMGDKNQCGCKPPKQENHMMDKCVCPENSEPDYIYGCKCKPGFSGPNCEPKDPCESNPCKNGGKCWPKKWGKFECDCTDTGGYGGDKCEIAPGCSDTDPCPDNQVCVEGAPNKCKCKPGFVGNPKDGCVCQSGQVLFEDKCIPDPCNSNDGHGGCPQLTENCISPGEDDCTDKDGCCVCKRGLHKAKDGSCIDPSELCCEEFGNEFGKTCGCRKECGWGKSVWGCKESIRDISSSGKCQSGYKCCCGTACKGEIDEFKDTCDDTDECDPKRCKNGNCAWGKYCKCNPGYVGKWCDKCKEGYVEKKDKWGKLKCVDPCEDNGPCQDGETCERMQMAPGFECVPSGGCTPPGQQGNCDDNEICVAGTGGEDNECVCQEPFEVCAGGCQCPDGQIQNGATCEEVECIDDCDCDIDQNQECGVDNTCKCKPGFSGSPCIDPCADNGSCVDGETCEICGSCAGGFECVPSGGCTPQDPDTCDDNEVCVAGTDGEDNECVCQEPFEVCGGGCQCPDGQIQNGATCEEVECIDDCDCGDNEECVNYECKCKAGFFGSPCIDPCANNGPCGENGDCFVDDGGMAKCNCDAGFDPANNCQISPCDNADCGQGTCHVSAEKEPEGFVCVCKPAFFGEACTETNPCDLRERPDTCQNGFACVGFDDDGNPIEPNGECACEPPYDGPNCEISPCDTDDASNDKCVNGDCIVDATEPNGFKCECCDGWEGALCATDPCDDLPCQNGGTCNRVAETCECINGCSGTLCDSCPGPIPGPCGESNNPCKPDGVATCTAMGEPAVAVCTCPTGYALVGNTCEDINECNIDEGPLANNCDPEGATCTNTPPGSWTCECNAPEFVDSDPDAKPGTECVVSGSGPPNGGGSSSSSSSSSSSGSSESGSGSGSGSGSSSSESGSSSSSGSGWGSKRGKNGRSKAANANANAYQNKEDEFMNENLYDDKTGENLKFTLDISPWILYISGGLILAFIALNYALCYYRSMSSKNYGISHEKVIDTKISMSGDDIGDEQSV